MLRRLAAEIDVVFEGVDVSQAGSSAEQNELYREATAPLVTMLDEVEDAMIASPGEVDAAMVATFHQLVRIIEPADANARAQRLIAMLLERDPSDFDAMLLKARYASAQGDHDARVDVLQKLIELPAPKVGLRGMRLNFAKRFALIELINAETVLAVKNGEPGVPDQQHLDSAIAYREELAKTFTAESAFLMMADAKISLARNDINTAQRLLVSFNNATQHQDVEGLLMAADIAERANQLGNALDFYETVLELRPSHLHALERIAGVLIALERNDDAAERIEELLDYDPQNELARQRLQIVEAKLGRNDDPIVVALVNAERIRLGSAGIAADPERALEMLRIATEEHGPDPRIMHMTAQTLLQIGRNDDAVALIDDGLQQFPDDRLLLMLQERIAASGSLEGTLAFIDSQNVPEATRLVNKYVAARNFGEDEQADAFLDEAMRVAPSDAAVIEQAFYRAMRNGDREEAERLAQLAEEHDVDRAGGLAFRATILIADDDFEGAAEALNQAVAIGTATSRTWRLLGEVRWQVGDHEGAIDAFAESVRINPNDVEAVTAYVGTLAATGASGEALRVAREKRRFLGQSPRLMDTWLRLEGAIGNRDVAIAQRKFIQSREPENRENLIALASLLVDNRNAAEARPLIDRLRAEEDSLALTAINARLLADQGDLQGAVDQFRAYLLSLPEAERTSTTMLSLGRFLIGRGRIGDGIAALEQAREYPDEPGVNTHIVLADALSQAGRFDEALGALQASVDEDRNVIDARKRMVIALLALDRADEAESTIAALGDVVEGDLELMILQSDVARAKGDSRAMRDILDRAVANFRESPIAYFKRADALKADPTRIQDVLKDLDTALKLRPGYSEALQLRAVLYFTLGREQDGINDLRLAVSSNPLNDRLRSILLSELLKRDRGRRGPERRAGGRSVPTRRSHAPGVDRRHLRAAPAMGARRALLRHGVGDAGRPARARALRRVAHPAQQDRHAEEAAGHPRHGGRHLRRAAHGPCAHARRGGQHAGGAARRRALARPAPGAGGLSGRPGSARSGRCSIGARHWSPSSPSSRRPGPRTDGSASSPRASSPSQTRPIRGSRRCSHSPRAPIRRSGTPR